MKTKELSEQLRDKIVEGHKSGDGCRIISETLSIPLSTVRSVINKWKVHHTTQTLPRPGRPSKLNNQARRKLVLDVTVKPTVTLKELQKSIAETGKNVSKSTISRALHNAGLMWRSYKESVTEKKPSEKQLGVSNKSFKVQHSVKKKELSEQLRGVVVERHRCGEGYKKISNTLNIPLGTVKSIVKKWQVYHTTQTLPRSGRPTKLNTHVRQKLLQDVTVKPGVTARELQKSVAKMDKNMCKSAICRALWNVDLTSQSDKESVTEKNPLEGQNDVSNKACKVQHSVKKKELSEQLRGVVVERHKCGEGYKKISNTLDIPLGTVRSIIKKWQVYPTTQTLPRSGRPSKLINQSRRRLVQDITVIPAVTVKELQKSIPEIDENVCKSTISHPLWNVDLTSQSDKESVTEKNPSESQHGVSNKACKVQHSVKKKELSEQLRGVVVEKHKCGEGYKKISNTLNIPLSTVRSIIKKWQVYHTTQTLPRSGRPTKLNTQARRKLVQDITVNPALTLKELQKSMADTDKNVCKSKIPQALGNVDLTSQSDKESVTEKKPSESQHGVSSKAIKVRHSVKKKELSEQLRGVVVEKHKCGEGYKKISNTLNIPLGTVRSIIKKWQVYHTTQTLPRSGRPSKLSNQAKKRLVQDVTVKPTITLKELQKSIAETGKNVSKSTISRALHNAGLTWRSDRERN
ncbi:uncharacterized protein LOC108938391 [Scleropages formosus]|uniref:uncharacterized protein LOC108938391 n=1 Tax=Scleropages formosus TaxID=113540 RepID=UPI0010FA912E|nr:uncharacterized protein LOC108938391 [Scleropages formosus]XP_018614452.2 uncharacterized protein LOC108938391 [Scleropages formosus]XP_018614453.2 uncharacterized protein LOC108938391 [Scleropages formosus]